MLSIIFPPELGLLFWPQQLSASPTSVSWHPGVSSQKQMDYIIDIGLELTGPLENYIQNPPGDFAIPGALDLGQSTATNISNSFLLVSFLTPLLFALISDLWLGRFKTLMIGLM